MLTPTKQFNSRGFSIKLLSLAIALVGFTASMVSTSNATTTGPTYERFGTAGVGTDDTGLLPNRYYAGWRFSPSRPNGAITILEGDGRTTIGGVIDSSVIIVGPEKPSGISTIIATFRANHSDLCEPQYGDETCLIGANTSGSYLYVHAIDGSIYQSNNLGVTWTQITSDLVLDRNLWTSDDISVSPDGSGVALATQDQVFYSNDFGKTFTEISSGIPGSPYPNWHLTMFTSNNDLYLGNTDGTGLEQYIYHITFPPRVSVTAGTVANSQVATIPSGIRTATIPASASLPATSLNFGGSVPDSVTVVPVASNPASVSATPFTISGSTKIVDIQISGTFSGSATVCLDGASTDHLYHFTGGAWVELASRTYVGGQVCGVTTSFSPFAAAAPAPVALVAAPVPDPVQQSKITALSVSTAIAGTPTPVEITGSFVEKIRAIQINGVALPAGSWTQTASSVAFTMPGKSAGTYQIQLFNGSAPVLKVQNFTFTAPIVAVAPTPAPTAKPKVTYIRCAKPGPGTRVAYGVNPTCPAGYVKK